MTTRKTPHPPQPQASPPVVGTAVPADAPRSAELVDTRLSRRPGTAPQTPAPQMPEPPLPMIELGRDTCGTFELALEREWQVTNGIGGFAAGTVSLANSRRYHGLLVAALKPPVARTVLVAKLDATARYLGREFAITTNEYHGGHIHPDGYRNIEAFRLDGGIPVWVFALADARLTQRIWMAQGQNTTYVKFTLEYASGPLELTLAPLCTHRDYHSHARGSWPLQVNAITGGLEIVAFAGARPYRLRCAGAEFRPSNDWYWNFRHRVESERGLDDAEDLFCPGRFVVRLEPGRSVTLVCTADGNVAPAEQSLAGERSRQQALLAPLPAAAPEWIRQLAIAADQFIVRREGAGDSGTTVIAGYPWFTDWGRDTMIALPGLTIAAGRPELAEKILRTFAQHVSQGLLPNRFPDGGEAPEYNTVDATLWYFQAVAASVKATRNVSLARDLYPVLTDIIDWHRRGTRYRIHVDPADGLIHAGEPGVQLTWMDAKVGDWVVTPRIGKPVEINALWVNALAVMADLAALLEHAEDAARYAAEAARTAESFRRRFWFETGGYLYDVVDGPDGRDDASLRPNQIFAVSLPYPLLDAQHSRAVVDACARELLTSAGLRSLAAGDRQYIGRYQGGPRERDGAYHQGTVWTWLLGPFALAHYRVHGDAGQAMRWLEPMAAHLREGCIGNVSEIFDGDPPHRPRGCYAQAWSVAEILRAWQKLHAAETDHS